MMMRTMLCALALAGCATPDEFTTLRREQFRNEDDRVVGHREFLRSKGTGEIVSRVELYAVVFDADGKVIGYEDRSKGGGAIVYDGEGRPIGSRMIDLRSRGTNPGSRGVIFMY